MLVVDTHAFFWWKVGHRKLSETARSALERAAVVYVPDIVLWEIGMLIEQRRFRLNVSLGRWLATAIAEPGVQLAPITPDIAAAAVSLGRVIRRDPADHLIAATALRLGLPLVTADAALQAAPAIETIW